MITNYDVCEVLYLFLFLFVSEDKSRKKETLYIIILLFHNIKMTDDNVSHRIPLDAPGGASYIKFRPFLTRSSPINNLVMCIFIFVINEIFCTHTTKLGN